MRLTYAFKIWFKAILLGYVGMLLYSYVIHNPLSPESAGYINEAVPWYLQLYTRTEEIFRYLLLATFPFFLIGLATYKEPGVETKEAGKSSFSSLKKRTMWPAYGLFLFTLMVPYVFMPRDSEGVDAMFVNITGAIFMCILIPMNLIVWIDCIRRSR